MDGLSNLIGDREATLEIAGKTYTLSTKTLFDYAERERYLLDRKPDLLKQLEGKKLPEDVVAAVIREAGKNRFVSFEEDGQFDQSIHGLCYRLWQTLQKHHAKDFPQPLDVYQLITAYGMERASELQEKLAELEEKSILKNSFSPETGTKPEPEQPEPASDHSTSDKSPGLKSSENSPSSTTGNPTESAS